MEVNVLGVKIDDVGMEEALEIVHGWLDKKEKKYIVTPNPEIIVSANIDKQYKTILNNADLSIPDGVGLKLSGKVKNHIPGADFMEELIKRSSDWGATVGLLGGAPGIAEKSAECLRKKYPGIKIIFAEGGGEVDAEGELLKHPKLLKSLSCDFLFVAFGPPKQEKWIANNLKNLDIKVAMGVGGSLDYISGTIPRAPVILRKLGLEWLFRLIIQPWRIKRQLALIKYLFMLLFKV